MNIPSFTAERALHPAGQVYRGRNSAYLIRSDSVVPQYLCLFGTCSCCGFEDCYQMNYLGPCLNLNSCEYDNFCGIKCTCYAPSR